jgi:hypothetical protein
VRYARSLPFLRREKLRVTMEQQGELALRYADGDTFRFVMIEPLLFRRVDADRLLAFREDKSGRITWMFIGNEAYEKLP